MISTRCIY